MNVFKTLNTYINKIIALVISLCVASIAGIILCEITLRNLFGMSMGIVVDIIRLIFMWMVFLGVVYLFKSHMLIKFEFFESKVSGKFKVVLFFVNRLVCLVLFIVMVISGKDLYEFVSIQYFSSFKLSLFWLYAPVPVSGILMIIGCIEELLSQTIELTAAKNCAIKEGGLK
ncbi:MAG: hypothetical protein K0S71_1498 [Clostridia bacterium]|nr:hypothetical protein [Clostridia bacterium]